MRPRAAAGRLGLAAAALACAAIAGCRSPTPEDAGRVVKTQTDSESAPDTTLRIRAMALAYREYENVARAAVAKLAYPANASEYEAMRGYGLLLVSVVSRDADELPLARVFFQGSGGGRNLKTLRTRLSEVPASEAAIVESIGRHRQDSLHLIPLELVREPGELRLAWAVGPQDFLLSEHPLSAPELGYAIGPPGNTPPSDAAIRALIEREIPMFAESGP